MFALLRMLLRRLPRILRGLRSAGARLADESPAKVFQAFAELARGAGASGRMKWYLFFTVLYGALGALVSPLLAMGILLGVAGYTDLRENRIYNYVTLPAVLVGLALSGLRGGFAGLGDGALGFLTGFGGLLVVYAFGGMSAGDVKLMGAIGALSGPSFTIWALLYSAVAGGLLSIGFGLAKGRLGRSLRNVFRTVLTFLTPWKVTEPLRPEESLVVPYGVAIVLGTTAAFVERHVLGGAR
jgi:prepilin peptidase CpaA